MRRADQIGRHQGRVLSMLVVMHPRPVDARWLNYAADPSGDQTRGARVLSALESRGLITRDHISRSVDRLAVLKWRITEPGVQAWLSWLPSFVDTSVMGINPARVAGPEESGGPVVRHE